MPRLPISPRYYTSEEKSEGLRIWSHMRAIGEHVYIFTVVESGGVRSILWTRCPLMHNDVHSMAKEM